MIKKYMLFLMLFGLHVGAMDVAPQPIAKEVNKKENIGKYEPVIEDISHKIILKTKSDDGVVSDEYILFDKNILPLVSQLQMLWKRRQDKNEYVIFVSDEFSLDTYAFVLHIAELFMSRKPDKIIKINQELNELNNLDELIEVLNCAWFLDVNDKVLKFFGIKIIDWIKKPNFLSEYKKLERLNSDFTQAYVIPQIKEEIIGHIKTMILKQEGNKRAKFFYERTGFISAGEFFGDSSKIILGAPDISIYDSSNAQELMQISEDSTHSLAVYKNKFIVTGAGPLFIWNVTNPQDIKRCTLAAQHDLGLQQMSFSSDGNYLAVANKHLPANTAEEDIHFWDLSRIDWSKQDAAIDGYKFDYGQGYISGICFIPGEHQFLTVIIKDSIAKLLRVNVMKNNDGSLYGVLQDENVILKNIPNDTWNKVAFSSNGDKVAFAYMSPEDRFYRIVIFDTISNSILVKEWKTTLIKRPSIAFSADDRWFICGGGNEISIYDSLTGNVLSILSVFDFPRSISCSLDGKKMLVVGGYPIQLWGNPNNVGIWTLLTDKEYDAIEEIKKAKMDPLFVYELYRASLLHKPLDVSKNTNNQTAFSSLDQDIQDVLKQNNLVEVSWVEWFKNRPWKKIFGGAVVGAAGVGLYKYMNQQK